MEFFSEAGVCCDGKRLQQDLTIASLPRFCSEIGQVLRDGEHEGEIYCLWGSFRVRREPIRNGVRFTLPGCPNALAWTVTSEASSGSGVVIHCTINRRDHEADFLESIELFVEAWRQGIEAELGTAG